MVYCVLFLLIKNVFHAFQSCRNIADPLDCYSSCLQLGPEGPRACWCTVQGQHLGGNNYTNKQAPPDQAKKSAAANWTQPVSEKFLLQVLLTETGSLVATYLPTEVALSINCIHHKCDLSLSSQQIDIGFEPCPMNVFLSSFCRMISSLRFFLIFSGCWLFCYLIQCAGFQPCFPSTVFRNEAFL